MNLYSVLFPLAVFAFASEITLNANADPTIAVMKPKAELRTVQKKSISENSTVKNDFFSVTILKGWSFVATTHAIPDWKEVGKVQAYITASPTEAIENSPIFFGVRDRNDRSVNLKKIQSLHAHDQEVKLSDEKIQGHSWKVLTYTAVGPNGMQEKHWLGSTQIKGKAFQFDGVLPLPDSNHMEAPILEMMKSIHIEAAPK